MSENVTELNNLIVTGNAINHCRENNQRSWFIGHFIDPDQGLRYTEELEVKWGEHSINETKLFPVASKVAKTLTLLIKGLFIVDFPEFNKSVYLKQAGDYVIFAPKVIHTWKAVENSVILTIRWPSIFMNFE